ncbi:alpha/beta hydrolase [Aliifodinibius sp. S!AR15-10]|uniref:alpha/beta fold hydrolase n=1 Tax=Aliifodinibius sp. S!AR15-10 TaxID=2950437 RepID=UPI00285910F5|nr:alpha/beta hydrolase [Aliifodinibius sp. S!AR15-10]MDR8394650.1 alpha/beta hydrolase [Aliifodinibius sp. S!AR15-10]
MSFKINVTLRALIVFSIILLISMEGLSQTPVKAETVTVNGTDIYYEVYGQGEPLFFLHGYTMSSKSWLPYVADYEKDFEVYLVDLRGHGKSSPFTEKLSIRSAAEDLNKLIDYLKLENISGIGFSFGGDVLFQLALLRPGLIKSMVIIGSCGSWNARDFPDWLEYLSYKNIDNLPWMRKQQTSEEQIKSILEQLINYNILVSEEELKSIQVPTLLVYGDQEDGLDWDCILSAKNNLPQSSLWVLPHTPHRAHFGDNKAEFTRVSKEFLSD